MNATRIINAAIAAAKTREGASRIEDWQIYSEYAEPGYAGPELPACIIVGDFNTISQWDNDTRRCIDIDDTPARAARLLDKIGCELEWSDEWVSCDGCGKLFRDSPDSYSWQMSGVIGDGYCVCLECIDPVEHLRELESNHQSCNTIDSIDPAEHGYRLVADGYEAGFHYGQDASPELIAQALEAQGISRYLFQLDSTGQFDARFSVYVHEDETSKLNRDEFNAAETDGPSRAAACKAALQDAAAKMSELPDNVDGVKYAQCKNDGTADIRVVSPQEFIEGIKP